METDAVVIAEHFERPTAAGLASFVPGGFVLLPTLRQNALLAGGGGPVCAVDLVTGHWGVMAPSLRLLQPRHSIDFGRGGASDEIVVSGWGSAERTGRWTDGPLATLVLRVPPGQPARLRIVAAVGFTRSAAPRGVIVKANGVPVARWDPDPENVARDVVVPAQPLGANGSLRLTFTIEKPFIPARIGLGPDVRRLGIFVSSLSADAS